MEVRIVVIGLCLGILAIAALYMTGGAFDSSARGEETEEMLAKNTAFGRRKKLPKRLWRSLLLRCCDGVRGAEDVKPYERWLTDNAYKILKVFEREQKIRRLPLYNGLPRVFLLARRAIENGNGKCNEATVRQSVTIFNRYGYLRYAEIVSMPHFCKLALAEYLALYASKSAVARQAYACGRRDGKRRRADLHQIDKVNYLRGFWATCNERDRRSMEQLCFDNGVDYHAMEEAQSLKESDYGVRVENAIRSLMDADSCFSGSVLLSYTKLHAYLLSADPDSYAVSDTATKFEYLKRIATVAKGGREISLARRKVAEAKAKKCDTYRVLVPKTPSMILFATLEILRLGVSVFASYWVWSALRAPVFSILLFPVSYCFWRDLCASVITSRPTFTPRVSRSDRIALIAISCLTLSKADAEYAVNRAKTVRKANPSIPVCLLVDLKESDRLVDETDEAVCAPFEQAEDFTVLVRDRKPIGDKYAAWEKKRGALIDLNALLLGERDVFHTVFGQELPRADTVITLDIDSDLIYADRAVKALSHPYFSDTSVLSFSSKSSIFSLKSLFSSLFSDCDGSYCTQGFSLASDLYGKGNFTGKGIYDVKRFYQATAEAFPDQRILSHDFIEGAVAGCKNVDVAVSEIAPQTFSQELARDCRWVRGDWQLLPYLLPFRKNARGEWVRNRIGWVNKGHIFHNLMRSLAVVVRLPLLILAAMRPVLLGLALSHLLVEPFFALLELRARPKRAGSRWLRLIYRAATAPTRSVYTFYAIVVTVFRLLRKKNLLKWTTFRHGTAAVFPIAELVCGVGLTVYSFFTFSVSSLMIGALFLSGAFRSVMEKERVFSCDPDVLRRVLPVLNATSAYFKENVTEATGYLIPDNVSEENGVTALRTSPTNVGFSLVALAELRKAGFVDEEEFVRKTDGAMQTLSCLEKYHGHLFNWYDLTTFRPLSPKYVSTVDSGNLCVCLAYVMGDLSEKSKQIAQKILKEIDFSFLLNDKRRLLSTGFDAEYMRMDDGCYDLTASESLLTYLFAVGEGKIEASCMAGLDGSLVWGKGNTLYSWTGGAFEYLMPALFVSYPPQSLLYQSASNAVRLQRSNSKPFWGVSESQYDAFDEGGNRKYHAFGMDAVAYKTTRESVKTPYASAMAISFCPKAVANNLASAVKTGMKGKWGMYEAHDGKPIRTYLAHHQGMIAVALSGYADGYRRRDAFSSLPFVRAAMLHWDAPRVEERAAKKRKSKAVLAQSSSIREENVYDFNLLASERYACSTTANGLGCGRFGETCAYDGGIEAFVKEGERVTSLTKGVLYRADGSRSVYERNAESFCATVSVTAARSVVGEIRKIQLQNKRDIPLTVTVGVYAEPILTEKQAFEAHKTYHRLFVTSHAETDTAFAERDGVFCALYLPGGTVAETDRGKILRGVASGRIVDTALLVSKEVTLMPREKTEIYAFFVCATTERHLRAQLGYCANCERDTEFLLSERACQTRSIGQWAKNTVAVLGEQKAPVGVRDVKTPCVIYEARADGVAYGLYEKARSLCLASPFTDGVSLCILYDESSVYYGKQRLKLEEIVRTASFGKPNKVFFHYFERTQHKAEIEKITACRFMPLGESRVYTKKRLLLPKAEPTVSLKLPPIMRKTDCGGFTARGFLVTKLPPKAWSNVVSNGRIGFLATEQGGGFTFLQSSREQKITDFSFDPLKDEPNEGVLLHEGGRVWSVTSRPSGRFVNRACEHSPGLTTYFCGENGIFCVQKCGIAGGTRFTCLTMENQSDTLREIEVVYFARLVLGDFVGNTRPHLAFERKENVLQARNGLNGIKVFASCSSAVTDYAFSLEQLRTQSGDWVVPRVWDKRKQTDGFCLATKLKIAPKRKAEVVFSLGTEPYPDFPRAQSFIEEHALTCRTLSAVTIKSGTELDNLAPWLVYQSEACRFTARCGFYQVGGAYGFRDQLQDCLALLYVDPQRVREHILLCASKQFESGDVLHWWHPPAIGVRTRVSDDRLFLPYVASEYIAFTGDESILEERVPFLKDVAFDKVLYTSFEQTVYTAPVKEHLERAIRISKFAPNGLALMGDGDWNDAMDRAGEKGKGSSVWLSMFLYLVINKCKTFLSSPDFYARICAKLRQSVAKTFDGESFARLVTDEGRMLGYNDGFIDLLTQSFAALSRITDEATANTALTSARRLVDEKRNLIRLLSPAFDRENDVGVIGNYPKGVRENGGQYTHAAVWYLIALYEMDRYEEAYELLERILPVNHAQNGEVLRYKVEPYVLAADVYAEKGAGEGGWTWYTGSASWAVVLIYRYLFGIRKKAKTVTLCPQLPRKLERATIEMAFSEGSAIVEIDNTGEGVWRLSENGVTFNTDSFVLSKQACKKYVLRKEKAS